MPYKVCPKCGHYIPDDSQSCPYCVIEKPAKKRKVILFVALTLLAAAAALVLILNNMDSETTQSSTYASTGTAQRYTTTYATAVPRTGTAGALAEAKSYLRFTAFSESGLKKQLEYEGFSAYESAYAVRNCGANWNEQA